MDTINMFAIFVLWDYMKELKQIEWLELLILYDDFLNCKITENKFQTELINEFSKNWNNQYFRKTVRKKYALYHNGMTDLISITGKSS
ncbi:hypothetical protein [Mycoplasma hafezii]|uniref:hypothetical protein n=1 Tax=Mycoplasma hafezii TaxID=525886 RepID=UPI003CF89491